MSDAEAISTPCEPGGFVGDIYFGHPLKSTMGTHRWSGSEWVALPSVVEALAALLAAAKAERDRLREALQQFLIEYDEVDLANAEPSSLTEAVLEARAALKGETP